MGQGVPLRSKGLEDCDVLNEITLQYYTHEEKSAEDLK